MQPRGLPVPGSWRHSSILLPQAFLHLLFPLPGEFFQLFTRFAPLSFWDLHWISFSQWRVLWLSCLELNPLPQYFLLSFPISSSLALITFIHNIFYFMHSPPPLERNPTRAGIFVLLLYPQSLEHSRRWKRTNELPYEAGTLFLYLSDVKTEMRENMHLSWGHNIGKWQLGLETNFAWPQSSPRAVGSWPSDMLHEV